MIDHPQSRTAALVHVDLDDPAKVRPRDGKTSGSLQVRGPWVIKRYFKAEQDATEADQRAASGEQAVAGASGEAEAGS